MKYARISENIVQEIFTLPIELTLEIFLNENDLIIFKKVFEQCTENVLVGWNKNKDGTFSEPVIETVTTNT